MRKRTRLVAVFLVSLFPGLIFAQSIPSAVVLAETPSPEPSWGTSVESMLVIGATHFTGYRSGVEIDNTFGKLNRFVVSATTDDFIVASFHLPAGAVIDGIEFVGCNSDASQTAQLELYRAPNDNVEFLGPLIVIPANSGCVEIRSSSINHVVDNTAGVYFILFNQAVLNATQSLNAARVYYKLQVSPPPIVPTFADVPNTNPLYPFVEALAASGITAGCGGGNFCPNDPLTRGQMAVFLAKALGLHFAP